MGAWRRSVISIGVAPASQTPVQVCFRAHAAKASPGRGRDRGALPLATSSAGDGRRRRERQRGRNAYERTTPGLKLRAPSVDFPAMPAKLDAGAWYGSLGPLDTADAMTYRITPHLGSPRPRWDAEAMELLWQRLDTAHNQALFAKVGSEVRATWRLDARLPVERDELIEVGRLAVLEIVREVCRRAPELEFDWFAVSPSVS
jgi:hypothetical protein